MSKGDGLAGRAAPPLFLPPPIPPKLLLLGALSGGEEGGVMSKGDGWAGGGFVSEKVNAGVVWGGAACAFSRRSCIDSGCACPFPTSGVPQLLCEEGARPQRSPTCGRSLARGRAVKGVSPDPGLSPTVRATDMSEMLFVEASESRCFTWFRGKGLGFRV